MATDYTDDDFIFDTQWRAMKRAIAGDCIISDGGITPGTLMNIILGAMDYAIAGTKYSETGQTLAIATADITDDRWDLVLGKTSGSPKVTVLTGTPGAIPKPPDLPASETLLGMVYVPAGTTQILAAHIRSFGFISTFLEHALNHQNGGKDEMVLTGLSGLLADDQHIIDAEAVSAMGAKADGNPLNHDRYLDAEAVAAMAAKSNTNALNHNKTGNTGQIIRVMNIEFPLKNNATGSETPNFSTTSTSEVEAIDKTSVIVPYSTSNPPFDTLLNTTRKAVFYALVYKPGSGVMTIRWRQGGVVKETITTASDTLYEYKFGTLQDLTNIGMQVDIKVASNVGHIAKAGIMVVDIINA